VTRQAFKLFEGETEDVPAGARLPPGTAIGPYHFEWTDEEWLIVVAGEVAIRRPEGEQTAVAGDVVCPAG
jgi:uncharacterized cupin superfamily protein